MALKIQCGEGVHSDQCYRVTSTSAPGNAAAYLSQVEVQDCGCATAIEGVLLNCVGDERMQISEGRITRYLGRLPSSGVVRRVRRRIVKDACKRNQIFGVPAQSVLEGWGHESIHRHADANG